MKPPIGLLGVSTLYFGYQSNNLLIAAVVALTIETSFLISPGVNNSTRHQSTVVFGSLLAFLVVFAINLSTVGIRGGVINTVTWLPFVFLPIVLLQCYSGDKENESINPVLSFIYRRNPEKSRKLNLHSGYIYFALCMLSGSVAATSGNENYLGLMALTIAALWKFRPQYYSLSLWGITVITVSALGYMGHIGLNNLQHALTDKAVELLSFSGDPDPYKSRTSIGHIGSLKQSDAIVMRIKLPRNSRLPYLLHRASYNKYFDNNWLARDTSLTPLQKENDSALWRVALTEEGNKVSDHKIHVSMKLRGGNGILSLPLGTTGFESNTISEVKRNHLSTTRVEGEPGYLHYVASVSGVETGSLPDENDLSIPPLELPTLKRIVAELNLENKSHQHAINAVDDYFYSNFAYSLYGESNSDESPLGNFLENTHAGHCEYFAAATVLLLRAAGIPARYATGFSVFEYSDLEKTHVVRLRHAHAWARAYVEDKWIDVDTTPDTWAEIEGKEAALWEPLLDLYTWLSFKLDGWDFKEKHSYALLVVFFLFLIISYCWKKYRHRQRDTGTGSLVATELKKLQGLDSEFHRIENRLAQDGLGKLPGESVKTWLERILALEPHLKKLPSLECIKELHYRYRFSSSGLAEGERKKLSNLSAQWMDSYSKFS